MLDIRYTNKKAIRNKKLTPSLHNILDEVSKELGVDVNVYSGGQDAKGKGTRRKGSTRHDHGNAGDIQVTRNGKKINFGKDKAFTKKFVTALKQRGVTGFGYSSAAKGSKGYYMGPTSMHVGYGKEAAWGAEGKSANTEPWFAELTSGTKASIARAAGTNLKMPNMQKYPHMAKQSSSLAKYIQKYGKKTAPTTKKPSLATPSIKREGIKREGIKMDDLNFRQKTPLTDNILPYANNVAALFDKAPPVPRPILNDPIALQRKNFDNDRNEVRRGARQAYLSLDQALDANTAAAAKSNVLAQRFGQMSKVNQADRNENIGIANRERMINSQVDQRNVGLLNDYNDTNMNRRIAQNQFRRDNWADATGKMIGAIDTRRALGHDENIIKYYMANDAYGTGKRAWARYQGIQQAPQSIQQQTQPKQMQPNSIRKSNINNTAKQRYFDYNAGKPSVQTNNGINYTANRPITQTGYTNPLLDDEHAILGMENRKHKTPPNLYKYGGYSSKVVANKLNYKSIR